MACLPDWAKANVHKPQPFASDAADTAIAPAAASLALLKRYECMATGFESLDTREVRFTGGPYWISTSVPTGTEAYSLLADLSGRRMQPCEAG